MNPLTISELCLTVLSYLHPYEGMTSLYVCKDWNNWFKSMIGNNLEAVVKKSLLEYPLLPVSFRYHKSLDLFDRACSLGYDNPIRYIKPKKTREEVKSEWFIRLSCICFRYHKLDALKTMKNKHLLTMINVMERRNDSSINNFLEVPAGCFKHEDTITSNYLIPMELVEYIIIFKSIYPYVVNEAYDGLVGLPFDGIPRYYSIGEQLRKKIGVESIQLLCNKYMPQVQVVDIPLVIVNTHKVKNLSWMNHKE